MDGSDAAAAPFSFSDLRMMFIELRGASTVDRSVPVPVTAPTPTPLHRPTLSTKKKRTRLLSGREGAEQLSKSLTPPRRSPVKQIVCPRLQLWTFWVRLPSSHTKTRRTSDRGDPETTA